MNRQFTEEEMHAADLIEEIKQLLAGLHITDEDFLDEVAKTVPELKEKILQLEGYNHP
ncbi:hypothetical protein ACFQPF_11855 [Fictibacillus iocasae]|uniref:Uncharacterized protein n=1 Tax=Fictibacillus iocasae TaxID=2715437 RepID=A0ABW2NWF8_9BACL